MITITTVTELNQLIQKYKLAKQTIGFVPTMGYLHEGHLSLVKQSQKQNAITIVSIFVNPTQFGPNEDFAKYPRDLARDQQLLASVNTDILFYPSVEEVYPKFTPVKNLTADVRLSNVACGLKRPGHFDGVVTVVARLFDIVQPERSYFGLKDYQQFLVIKKMAEQQKYNIEIIGCPIVREPDGLAMSSRNKYLSATHRSNAPQINQILQSAKALLIKETEIAKVKQYIVDSIGQIPEATLDYIEICNADTIESTNVYIPNKTIMLIAVFVGKTRLIDNGVC